MNRLNGGECGSPGCDEKAAYATDLKGGIGTVCNKHAEQFEPDGKRYRAKLQATEKIISETGIVEPRADVVVHDGWKDKEGSK